MIILGSLRDPPYQLLELSRRISEVFDDCMSKNKDFYYMLFFYFVNVSWPQQALVPARREARAKWRYAPSEWLIR